MPTYDYKCNSCGEEFELFQSMSDDPIDKCSQCGVEGEVIRLIGGGAGIIFKGSGFYVNDSKSESKSKKSSLKSSSDSKPETKKSEKTAKTPKKSKETA